jgi:hypothetical protein
MVPDELSGLATPETAEPTVSAEPTSTGEPDATDTTEPIATAAISTGIVVNTDGDLVNCRLRPVDGEPITQLAEGDSIEVTGPTEDGWYPVICDGQAGYISADFVAVGNAANQETVPTETTELIPTETVTNEPSPTAIATEEATTIPEPTAEPTEEPEQTPYPIYDTGDTEQSHDAVYASDNDPDTWWSVVPNQSPEQTRLYFDLGSVVPIDRITIELAVGGMLPYFEIWLSEDAETWYNATPNGINGWNLWADEAHVFTLEYDARYIRLVIPNVDESGLSEVGGIRQVEIWAGDINQTQYLSALGEPTTPTPAPEPTAEPTVEPTEEVAEEPTEEYVDHPTEEPAPEPTATEEVTPTEEQVEEAPVGDEAPPIEGNPSDDEAAGYLIETYL